MGVDGCRGCAFWGLLKIGTRCGFGRNGAMCRRRTKNFRRGDFRGAGIDLRSPIQTRLKSTPFTVYPRVCGGTFGAVPVCRLCAERGARAVLAAVEAVFEERAAVQQVGGAPFWSSAVNGGNLLLLRSTTGSWSTRSGHLNFDWFTGVSAAGLAAGVLGAHAANGAGAVYGKQVGTYFEREALWRQVVDQLAAADRLCYGVDEQRLLRFWAVDGADAAPVAFEGGGANLGAFIGRRVAVAGAEFVLTGASFDAMTGRAELSAPGQVSATVAGARVGVV